MDLERTMEFILEQHAKTEAVLADLAARQEAAERRQEAAERRMEAADRRTDRFERNLTRLAKLGMRSRNDLKRRAEENEKWIEGQKLLMQEITEKLNGLIGYVDRLPKTPPPA
jgi:Ni/Co efflux regulator RcnB